jgi:hypothetical protein
LTSVPEKARLNSLGLSDDKTVDPLSAFSVAIVALSGFVNLTERALAGQKLKSLTKLAGAIQWAQQHGFV